MALLGNNSLRVYLRALELDDYKNSHAWRNDNEIWDSLVGPRYYVSEAYEKKWVEEKISNQDNQRFFAVCLKENNLFIGIASINNIDWFNRVASTSRIIGEEDYRGIGIGKEITGLLLYHAFVELGLERIESRQLLDNQPSIKSLERCGYKTEGIMRNAVYKKGKRRDLNLMSILREDYLAQQASI